ncbi:MAG: hypothetical protein R3D67_18465 [Hyphomicrobiaceae bacterium]
MDHGRGAQPVPPSEHVLPACNSDFGPQRWAFCVLAQHLVTIAVEMLRYTGVADDLVEEARMIRWQARVRRSALRAVAILAVVAAPTGVLEAQAGGPFSYLSGTWSGAAQVRLTSGNTETLKCRAYYSPKEAGAGLGLAIRCASASSRIELRAQLAQTGHDITGQWEERTYNASGNVTGRGRDGNFALSIVGGGFKGTMAVQTNGSNQTVTIRTEGVTLKSVNISLSKA